MPRRRKYRPKARSVTVSALEQHPQAHDDQDDTEDSDHEPPERHVRHPVAIRIAPPEPRENRYPSPLSLRRGLCVPLREEHEEEAHHDQGNAGKCPSRQKSRTAKVEVIQTVPTVQR